MISFLSEFMSFHVIILLLVFLFDFTLFCFVFVSIENVNNQQKKKKKQHRYDIDPFLRIFVVDQYFFIYISRFVYFKLLVGMIFISLNDFFWPSKLQHLSVDTFQCRHSVERREKQTVLIALIFFLRFFLSIFTIMFWHYLLCFVIYAN